MSNNTYNGNQWYQSSSVASLRLKVGALVTVLAAGVAFYPSEKINDLFQPKTHVAQVYDKNNNSCLAYDTKIYTLKEDIAREGEGIGALLSRRGQRLTPTLEEAFKEANKGKKFLMGSGLYERKQYLVPAPDKENKCK